MFPHVRPRWLLPFYLGALGACRKGSENIDLVPVVPSDAGTQGCAVLAGVPRNAVVVFQDVGIGPASQLAAARGSETLYWTAEDGGIHELTFPSGGGPPTDTLLVAPGVIETDYLVPAGIVQPAELSGLAVLDANSLVVAEHRSNSLLSVSRVNADEVAAFAGMPAPVGGFASGLGPNARFHFTSTVSLLADAAGLVYVADPENHALRQVAVDPLGGPTFVTTVVGSGAPGDGTGAFSQTTFDTPSGLAAGCGGELFVVESGSAGLGGNRLSLLTLFGAGPFGGLDGDALVLAGDGTDATSEGLGTLAQLGTPMGLLSSEDGELYWMDAGSRVLRRHSLASMLTDCPMFVDCATAVAGPGPFSGANFALALGDSGAVYVLDADAETLFRVDP
jgi:hypothetical protein